MLVLFFFIVFHSINIFLCYQDIRYKYISFFCFILLIFSLSGIIFSLSSSGSIVGVSLFFSVCLLTSVLKKKLTIAYADIIYIFLCLLILEESWPVFFIFLGILSVLTYVLMKGRKDKIIPFFPSIYISFALTFYLF